MSLEDIRRNIKDADAFKNYDNVVKDLERCREAAKIKDDTIKDLNQKVAELQTSVGRLETESKGQSSALGTCKTELDDARKENEKLAKSNKTLEELRATTDGKTLPEVKAEVIKATDAEIEKRSDARVTEKLKNWETEEKPNLVRQAAIDILQHHINGYAQQLVDESAHTVTMVAADIVQTGIDRDIVRILNREVTRMLDVESDKKVEAASEEKSKTKLEQLVRVAWPKFVSEYVEPKARELESLIRRILPDFLVDDFVIRCNKCLTEQTIAMTPVLVAEIIASGKTTTECQNTQCRVGLGPFTSRYRMTLSLDALIAGALGATSPPAGS